MSREFQSFTDFWPFYVREHSRKETRQFHFAGTTLALLCLLRAVATGKWQWLLVGLVAGYGPAWYSHFMIEKNKPATFRYPLWSLRADFVMWGKTIAGTMDAEVARAMLTNGRKPVTIDVEVAPN